MGRSCNKYGESRGAYRVLVENQREKDYLEDPALDGSVI
jgi:hypothetical protein